MSKQVKMDPEATLESGTPAIRGEVPQVWPEVGSFACLDATTLCVVRKVSDLLVVETQDATIVEAVDPSRLEPRPQRSTNPGGHGVTQWERFQVALKVAQAKRP